MTARERRPAGGRGAEQTDQHGGLDLSLDHPSDTTPYQVMPPLTADEYAALKADIAAHGVRVPVDVDEHGQLLDGHHRARACTELGIDCPRRVVPGLTDDEKHDHAVAVNAQRRQLSREQKRELIAAELRRDPSRSDRAIAHLLGVSHHTVGAMRRGGWTTGPADGEQHHHDEHDHPDAIGLIAPSPEAARNISSTVQLAIAQYIDAVQDGYQEGLPAGWLLRSVTASVASWPPAVREALRFALSDVLAALALADADERARHGNELIDKAITALDNGTPA